MMGKKRLFLFVFILLFCWFYPGINFFTGNPEAFLQKRAPASKIEKFFNDSYLTGQPVVTAQCYQVVVPKGWEAETSLIWPSALSETGVSGIDIKDGIVCFVLEPGETKWIFTKVKSTGSGKKDEKRSKVEYNLLETISNPIINSNEERIDAHKKTAPILI